jgi:hypothetical protein
VVGAILTGFAALLFSLLAHLSGDATGAGLGLIAAALAFGLLANACFRA